MVIGADGGIIAGHGRFEAAKLLGIEEVPTLMLSHLSADERRAYILADNQLALNAGSDKDILAIKRQALIDVEFDLELTASPLRRLICYLMRQAVRGMALLKPAVEDGALPLAVLRDRDGSFEPELVKKGQTRIEGMASRASRRPSPLPSRTPRFRPASSI